MHYSPLVVTLSAMQEDAPREAVPNEFMPENYFTTHNGESIFGNNNPLEVDLGCGDGKFILEMAGRYPERNFLGVERLLGRVKKVCKKANKKGLDNLKVLRLDSKYTVEWLLSENSISRLHLLCPDPWPKEKHHKRRLFQVSFLAALHKVIKPNGEFCFKTDHEEYFEWSLDQVNEFGKFPQLPWQDDSFFYPKTDFQLQWEAEGKSIHRLRLQVP